MTISRKHKFITIPIALIILLYLIGPSPDAPTYSLDMPIVPQEADALEQYIALQEAQHKLKPDNEARIVWADSSKKKTEYSVVYLPGFSASQAEGDPVHRQFAKAFGCNLYLARMSDHGIDTTEQLLYFTPDRFWKSSKEALAIGKALGEKVIIMSTSTGGTMALLLAADYPMDVFALINMSPNIEINDPLAFAANNPWGLQVARQVKGGKYNITRITPGADSTLDMRYWNHRYRLEAVTQLQEMLESSMTKSTFHKVKCPSLTLYYYKNEKEQDPTVKVSAMEKMNTHLSTPEKSKVMVAIPNAGGHVIGSYVVSKDVKQVAAEITNFAIGILKMTPAGNKE
ncbi:alpha/beta hydrolase [soil metagenome]